jgi:Tfp pilus assembly protein PilO
MLSQMKKLDFLHLRGVSPDKILEFLREQKLLLIFFLVLLVLCVFGFQSFIGPEIEKMIDLRRKLSKINERLFTLQKELVSHPNIQKETQILKQQFDILEKEFPPERRFLSLAQEVLSGLESEGIKIINFKYLYDLKEETPPGVKKYGLELELLTDYLVLGRFLESMENKGLKFCIDKISITRLSDQGLDVKLKLIFILREEK